MQTLPVAGDALHSPAAAYSSSAGQAKLDPRGKKKSSSGKERGFFLVFLPCILHRTISKRIAFRRHTCTGWSSGCILNLLVVFFSSFYWLLATLLSMDQAKANVRGFLFFIVEGSYCVFGCEEFASVWMWIFFIPPSV